MPLETKEIGVSVPPPEAGGTPPPSATSPSQLSKITTACVAWVLKTLRARQQQK